MFCAQCGAELHDGSKFCPQCGNALTTTSSPKSMTYKAGRTFSNNPFLTLVLVGLGIILLLVVGRNVEHRGTTQFSAQPASPQVYPHQESITNTAFTVKAGQYMYYKFAVPPNATNVWVDGNFTASGGSGNDVEVYLFDEDAFVNWQNHHSVKVYYNSGRSTENKIFSRLPSGSGTYYLLFSNAFSLITPKAVQASAMLHYTN
jgi:hypothetical protein